MENNFESEKYYKTVIDGIEQMIKTGELKPGDKLPPERTLAERFNVSRVPVHEALKVLEYLDIVDSSQGSGTYLKSDKSKPSLVLSDLSNIPVEELVIKFFDIRIVLESYAASEAAKNRTDDDILTMKKAIAGIRELSEVENLSPDQLEKLRRQTQAFHLSVIAASHNCVLSALYKSFDDLLKITRFYTVHTSSYNSLIVHETIMDKIINKDSEGAQKTMSGHFKDIKFHLENSDFTFGDFEALF